MKEGIKLQAKINILEPHIANKIAAGEVVERPASIVKELIENAIDAKATRIDIEITAGGLESIKVSDDGEGMTPLDAELAFVRHATSKIKNLEDLYHISTLGFRGEALPSIAAVSKVQLLTRTPACIEGTKLEIHAGKILTKEPFGCPKGTIITIKELFYNTPARRKFLKSPLKEAGYVADIVNRFALINPQIAFKLVSDEKVILQTSGNNDPLAAIAEVYNIQLAKGLLPLECEFEGGQIKGYIGQNNQYRATRDLQNFFVNGRYVHNLKLSRALENGYRGTIPVKRFPICIINISLPWEDVDVNVHPAKLEVRLKKEEQILTKLTEVVQETLNQKTTLFPKKQEKEKAKVSYVQLDLKLPPKSREKVMVKEALEEELVRSKNDSLSQEHAPFSSFPENIISKIIQEEEHLPEPFLEEQEKEKEGTTDKLPPLSIIGQLHNSYILAQGENGLYIIDQHAAHERIMYEELWEKFKQQKYLDSQTLALPLTLELTYPETVQLIDNILLFNNLGIVMEHFGGNTFLVRGLPVGFTAEEGRELILSLLVEVQNNNQEPVIEDDFIKLLACKKAVKAKQKLAPPEMDYLLQKLNRTNFPFTCPHGRPTIISLTLEELARKFLRT